MDLLELMHDYINQYGYMDSFIDYCEVQEGHDRDDINDAIDKQFYGG